MKNMKWNVEWPDILLPYKNKIENTVKPFIQVDLSSQSSFNVWESNFGGRPYWPKSKPFPKDAHELPMFLLAQLNFAEMPQLTPFPKSGILQFFISAHEDSLCGVDFENPTNQTGFRIEYHPEVVQDEDLLVTEFAEPLSYENMPIEKSCSLRFRLDYQPVGMEDYQFEELTGINIDDLDDELHESISEFVRNDGHKIGGYAAFTQEDPRGYIKKNENRSEEDFSILLFQMDSEGPIMWGDAGVANFFISEGDLKRCDFSNVLYTWDCC